MKRLAWFTLPFIPAMLAACGNSAPPALGTIDNLIALSPATTQSGQPAVTGTVTFENKGGSVLEYTATVSYPNTYTDAQKWLTFTSGAKGTVQPKATQSVSFSAQCPNEAGTYIATVTITSGKLSKSTDVKLTCLAPTSNPTDPTDPPTDPVILHAPVFNGNVKASFVKVDTGHVVVVTGKVSDTDTPLDQLILKYTLGDPANADAYQVVSDAIDTTDGTFRFTIPDSATFPEGQETTFTVAVKDTTDGERITRQTVAFTKDTTAPTLTDSEVEVIQKAASQDVNASVVSADTSIDRVTYTLNGGTETNVPVGENGFSVTLPDLAPGTYTVVIRAYDTVGNVTAITREVTVTDQLAPSEVTFTSSASMVTSEGSVTLTADGTDNVGISKVVFYEVVNGQDVELGTDESAPYEVTRSFSTSKDNGTKTYKAVLFDAAGNRTASSTVTVDVNIPADTTDPEITGLKAVRSGNSTNAKVSATITDNVKVKSVRINYKQIDGTIVDEDVTSFLTGSTFSYMTKPIDINATITLTVTDTSDNSKTNTAIVTSK